LARASTVEREWGFVARSRAFSVPSVLSLTSFHLVHSTARAISTASLAVSSPKQKSDVAASQSALDRRACHIRVAFSAGERSCGSEQHGSGNPERITSNSSNVWRGARSK
jgi:hypothetical protein